LKHQVKYERSSELLESGRCVEVCIKKTCIKLRRKVSLKKYKSVSLLWLYNKNPITPGEVYSKKKGVLGKQNPKKHHTEIDATGGINRRGDTTRKSVVQDGVVVGSGSIKILSCYR